MNPHFSCRTVGSWLVVEFLTTDMTDLVTLEKMHADLARYVDAHKPQHIILDFENVEYVSSKAIVIVIDTSKKLGALPHARLVLCAVPPKIMEVLKTLHLDRILRIVPTQDDALAVSTA